MHRAQIRIFERILPQIQWLTLALQVVELAPLNRFANYSLNTGFQSIQL
jgi:hypothetical protein